MMLILSLIHIFILDSEVTAINGSERLESLGIRNKVSGEEQTLDVDAVFIAIGHVPDNKAFASLVAVSYTHLDVYKRQSLACLYLSGGKYHWLPDCLY